MSIVRVPRKPGVDEIMFRTRAVEAACEYLIETISLSSMKWLLDFLKASCPWHNSCFDVRTGKVTNGPAKVDLKTFKVETHDGKICVGVPRDGKSS